MAELWEVELGDAAIQLISAQWLQTSSSLKLLIQILTGRGLSQGRDQNQGSSERSDQDQDRDMNLSLSLDIISPPTSGKEDY